MFDGQKLHKGDYSIEINDNITEGQGSIFQSELGIGNNLVVSSEAMLKNLRAIQERKDIDPISEIEKDFEKLRNSEADKIKCGRKHFEAIGANFDIVTSAGEL